jgi:heme/copper-type cytochrome/quinol oxidase subunit 2
VGSAFFGWLAATGMAVLLTALVAAGGAAVSLAQGNGADAPETVGLTEGIVLLVIFFVAYYCGGYVASRMARFNGMKQGVAVWIWAVVIAIVVAIAATVAGDQYDIQSELNNFPRIPSNEGDVTTNGIIAALAIAAVTLVGAIMGGLAGMRFHRRVDKAGLGR